MFAEHLVHSRHRALLHNSMMAFVVVEAQSFEKLQLLRMFAGIKFHGIMRSAKWFWLEIVNKSSIVSKSRAKAKHKKLIKINYRLRLFHTRSIELEALAVWDWLWTSIKWALFGVPPMHRLEEKRNKKTFLEFLKWIQFWHKPHKPFVDSLSSILKITETSW